MDGTIVYENIMINTEESNNKVIEWIENNNDKLYKLAFPHGENLLHWCGASNNHVICQYLMDIENMATNISGSRSASPLYYAASKNSFEVIEILLNNGADIRDRSGFSGKFPFEVCNDEIKEYMLTYENQIPINYDDECILKEGFTMTQGFNYRVKRFYSMVLTTAMHKMNNTYNLGITDDKYSEKILKNNDFFAILEMYNVAMDKYKQDLSGHGKKCLSCNKKGKLLKCGACKSVHYCSMDCQKKCHFLHKYDCFEKSD